MISKISSKLIFYSYLFVSCIQLTKSADFYKFNANEDKQPNQINWSRISNNVLSNSSKIIPSTNFDLVSTEKKNFLEDNSQSLFTNTRKNL